MQKLNIFTVNHFAKLLLIPRKILEEIADLAPELYSPYDKKKPNGKIRHIDNPRQKIKQIQRQIYKIFLKKLDYPNYMIGGIKGRQPYLHARVHTRANLVITIDVKKCFPSISNEMVYLVWRNLLGCSRDVASLATKLTTFEWHLPQGSPTSTALANLVLLPAMEQISILAKDFKMRQPTIFIDDLAISGANLNNDLITFIAKEFSKINLKINRGKDKLKVMRKSSPQEVIKKSVNNGVLIPRFKRRRINAAMYQLEKSPSFDEKLFQSVRGRIIDLQTLHPVEAKKKMSRLNEILSRKIAGK